MKKLISACSLLILFCTNYDTFAVQESSLSVRSNDPEFAWQKDWHERQRWGGRVGYIDKNNNLKARLTEGDSAQWVTVAKGIKDFQLLDNRVAILQKNGALLLSEGVLKNSFRLVSNSVEKFQLTNTRIGMLSTNGIFSVKEVGFKPELVASGINAFHIIANRSALLDEAGTLWAQQGGTVGRYIAIASKVRDFQLERDWLIYLDESANLMATRGVINKDLKFNKIGESVDIFESEAYVVADATQPTYRLRIAAVDKSGYLSYGDSENSNFKLQKIANSGLAKKINWNAGRLAVISPTGEVSVADTDGAGQLNSFSWKGVFDEFHQGSEDLSLHRIGTSLFLRRGSETLTAARSAEAAKKDTQIATDISQAAKIAITSVRPATLRKSVFSDKFSGNVSNKSSGQSAVFFNSPSPEVDLFEEQSSSTKQ